MISVNSRHRQTLKSIFSNPVRANIHWDEIEKLLIALGSEIEEGNGSRVRVALNGTRAVYHRPHPGKEADRGAVKDVRRFLTEAGVKMR